MIKLQCRDDPDFTTKIEPVAGERIVLTVPYALVCAMIEQVDLWVALLPVTQFGVCLNEAIDRLPGDFEESRRDTEPFDAPIVPDNRRSIQAWNQPPHVFFFVFFVPVCSRDNIAGSFDQRQKVLRSP